MQISFSRNAYINETKFFPRDYGKRTILPSKYKEVQELFCMMLVMLLSRRPNCKEILYNKNSWALEKNEFDFEKEIRHAIESKGKNENRYIYTIMESKLEEYTKELEIEKDISINAEKFIKKSVDWGISKKSHEKYDFNHKSIYYKVKDYFEDNIKLSLKTEEKLFIITKSDIFYEIDIYHENIYIFIESNDNSIIESMIFKELCSRRVIDLKYGSDKYIARTLDGKIYCWSFGKFGESNFPHRNKPELNENLSNLNIIDIKCGAFHTLALTSSGQVYDWTLTGDSCETFGTPKKIMGFDDEKIVRISCGFYHSMLLTESGRVFCWGYNNFDNLDIEAIFQSKTPKLIELNDIAIDKISCGQNHSLLLTKGGVIYAFGYNNFGQIGVGNTEKQLNPIKLNHEKKFIDIASHWKENISIALSCDSIYYVWGDCGEENILMPTEIKCRSFNEIFNNYFGYSFDVSEDLLEFSDKFFRNGYYEKNFEKIEELGKGSFARVSKNLSKVDHKLYAIKKIKFNHEDHCENRELKHFPLVSRLKNDYVVKYYEYWLEINFKHKIILYIKMELCDGTLKNLINEIKYDPNLKKGKSLTSIGYYIASQLFIEILEGVNYLHKNNIIHRNLNPYNIMFKLDKSCKSFIKVGGLGFITTHYFVGQSHTLDVGSPKYVAPEAISCEKYDTKADIFSLSVIMEELFDIDYEE